MKKILILLTLLLIGCASRKVSKKSENLKIIEIINVKDKLSITQHIDEKTIDTSFCYEEQFEPVDSSKPMVIDRKNGIFKNTRFKTSKTKKGLSILKKEDSSLNQRKTTLNKTSVDIKTKDKETERKTLLPWWWWILVLITLGCYLIYRRYRI